MYYCTTAPYIIFSWHKRSNWFYLCYLQLKIADNLGQSPEHNMGHVMSCHVMSCHVMSCHTWQVDQAPDHGNYQLHPGNGEGDGKLGPGVTCEMYHVQCWLHVTIVTCFVRVTSNQVAGRNYTSETRSWVALQTWPPSYHRSHVMWSPQYC